MAQVKICAELPHGSGSVTKSPPMSEGRENDDSDGGVAIQVCPRMLAGPRLVATLATGVCASACVSRVC